MEYCKDYYKILQVDPTADQEIIKVIYKNLVRVYHPDINASSDARIKMQELNEAYAILGSPQRRAHYDRWFHTQNQSSSTPSGSMRMEQTQTIHGQKIHVDVNVNVGPGVSSRPAQAKKTVQSQRPLPQNAIRTWVAKSKYIALVPLVLLIGWFAWQEWGKTPISCQFQRGRMFQSRLILTNGSELSYHGVSLQVHIPGGPVKYYYPTWDGNERKSIFVDMDTMPRFISIDFSSEEQHFKRHCYIKKN
jgi:hypothetical protein